MPNNDEQERLTKLNSILAIRRSDGAKIAAKRLVINSETPIRWNVVLKDRTEKYIFDELSMFEDTEWDKQKQYSTSELFDLTQKAGFTDWKQIPLAMWGGWELVGSEYKQRLFPQYELPDLTSYKID